MAAICSAAVGSGSPASQAAWSWASSSAVDRCAGSPHAAWTQRGAAGVPALVKPSPRWPLRVQVHRAGGPGFSMTSASPVSSATRSQQGAQYGCGTPTSSAKPLT